MGNFDHFSRFGNEFFRHQQEYGEEKFLYNTLSSENVLKHGIKVVYFAVEYEKNYNPVFNEDAKPLTADNPSNFSFECMMMPNNLPTEDEEWSAFGQSQTDTFKLYVNIETFRQLARRKIGADYVPHINDKIKLVYNDLFLDITYVNNDLNDEKFLQNSYTWEISTRKMKVHGGIDSVNPDMQELVDLFDFNINRGSIAEEIKTLADGVAPPAGKPDPSTTFPASGKGKPKILFTPDPTEKLPQFKNDGF